MLISRLACQASSAKKLKSELDTLRLQELRLIKQVEGLENESKTLTQELCSLKAVRGSCPSLSCLTHACNVRNTRRSVQHSNRRLQSVSCCCRTQTRTRKHSKRSVARSSSSLMKHNRRCLRRRPSFKSTTRHHSSLKHASSHCPRFALVC